jgi:hypothetical protein
MPPDTDEINVDELLASITDDDEQAMLNDVERIRAEIRKLEQRIAAAQPRLNREARKVLERILQDWETALALVTDARYPHEVTAKRAAILYLLPPRRWLGETPTFLDPRQLDVAKRLAQILEPDFQRYRAWRNAIGG